MIISINEDNDPDVTLLFFSPHTCNVGSVTNVKINLFYKNYLDWFVFH